MAVKSKDGKGLYMSCRCGCGDAVELEIDNEDPDMYFYQSHLNGNFYRDQCGGFRTIREKIRKSGGLFVIKIIAIRKFVCKKRI